MATINVEVQFEALENTELNNFVDELYSFLSVGRTKVPRAVQGNRSKRLRA
jgi:RNase P protein component